MAYRFLPEAFTRLLRRLCLKVGAGLLALVTLAFLAALLSYSPLDSSLNTASFTSHNSLGVFGAFVADMTFQLMGWSGYVVVPVFLLWAWRLFWEGRVARIRRKTFALFILVSDLPFVFGFFSLSRGGLLGRWGPLMPWPLVGLGAVASLVLFVYLMELRAPLWEALKKVGALLRSRAPTSFVEVPCVPELSEKPPPSEKSPPLKKKEARAAPRRVVSSPPGTYTLPLLDILTHDEKGRSGHKEQKEKNVQLLEAVLKDFGVQGHISGFRAGPVVTLYELVPAPGIKTSRVIGLADDIARSMSALSVRIATVPGRNVIGIELPNTRRLTVRLHGVLMSDVYKKGHAILPLALGQDIEGVPHVADLAAMPHLLMAGTTGSGKSVGLNAMILSLLYALTPRECRFIMIDPKMLELSIYDGIPHLLTPVVTDPKKAVVALKWAVREMERRYHVMAKLSVRHIEGYNKKVRDVKQAGETSVSHQVHVGFDPDTGQPLYEEEVLQVDEEPYIVVIVDEMADLMLVAGKEIESSVQRLAQMARAAGIHLIMATQRPSVDVITGTIKANFPHRISFMVTSKIDSRTILGEQGAEQLLGKGDMLFMEGGGRLKRIHAPFVTEEEVSEVCTHLKAQPWEREEKPLVLEDVDENENLGERDGKERDDLYDQAVAIVLDTGRASTSFVQRQLQIGYNRASRIIEEMENDGLVSPANHAGKRTILAQR